MENNVYKVEEEVGTRGGKLIKVIFNKDTNKEEVSKIVDKYNGKLYFYNNKDAIPVNVPKDKEEYYVDKFLQYKEIDDDG